MKIASHILMWIFIVMQETQRNNQLWICKWLNMNPPIWCEHSIWNAIMNWGSAGASQKMWGAATLLSETDVNNIVPNNEEQLMICYICKVLHFKVKMQHVQNTTRCELFILWCEDMSLWKAKDPSHKEIYVKSLQTLQKLQLEILNKGQLISAKPMQENCKPQRLFAVYIVTKWLVWMASTLKLWFDGDLKKHNAH